MTKDEWKKIIGSIKPSECLEEFAYIIRALTEVRDEKRATKEGG
jgi:hypothetical protein